MTTIWPSVDVSGSVTSGVIAVVNLISYVDPGVGDICVVICLIIIFTTAVAIVTIDINFIV